MPVDFPASDTERLVQPPYRRTLETAKWSHCSNRMVRLSGYATHVSLLLVPNTLNPGLHTNRRRPDAVAN